MQTQKINFTMLYGVERNYKGTEQRRYIYTGEQLVRLENRNRKTFGVYSRGFHPENIPQAMTEADLDGLESGFWSNDTYVIQKINSEEELKKLSQKIRNDNFINERYFSFIKGKLNTQDKNLIDDLEKNLNIKVNEYLDINTGCVAEATFDDNQHINIGQIKYDTGSYLIIGTPIIFVTY